MNDVLIAAACAFFLILGCCLGYIICWQRQKRAVPMPENNGRAPSAESMADLKSMAEALLQSEDRYRAISDATADAVMLHENGYIIQINQSAERMLGYRSDELVGRHGLDLLVAPESQYDI